MLEDLGNKQLLELLVHQDDSMMELKPPHRQAGVQD